MKKNKVIYVSGPVTMEVQRTLFGLKVTITDTSKLITKAKGGLEELFTGEDK